MNPRFLSNMASHDAASITCEALLLGLTPERYALRSIESVKPADLEQAILALPFSNALALLDCLMGWLAGGVAWHILPATSSNAL